MRSWMLWFLSGPAGMWLMGVLRFTGAQRGVCVLILLKVAKLGKALPVQVDCRGDQNDNNNDSCNNSNDDGSYMAVRILCGSVNWRRNKSPVSESWLYWEQKAFFNPCLSAWFILCCLTNVTFWSDVTPRSCMLCIHGAAFTSPLGDPTPSVCLGDHRCWPTGLPIYSMEMKSTFSLLHNNTLFLKALCVTQMKSKIVLLPILSMSQLCPVYSSEHSQ